MYVPLCFAYILPVKRYGLLDNAIPPETSKMSKRPFVVMGLLDCLAGTLLTFAAVYLPGSLLVLLPQAAIPISMILSRRIKREKYAVHQCLGAFVVVLGIVLAVLGPLLLLSRGRDPDYACVAYDVNSKARQKTGNQSSCKPAISLPSPMVFLAIGLCLSRW